MNLKLQSSLVKLLMLVMTTKSDLKSTKYQILMLKRQERKAKKAKKDCLDHLVERMKINIRPLTL